MTNIKFKTHNIPLFVLLALYIALAATYSATTPLGEGPDEPGHAAYVFMLARTGRLPDPISNKLPGEGHQPPLAYALAVPAVLWLSADDYRYEQPGNPRFVWAGGTQPNAVAHGNAEFWPWRGAVLAWHLMRLVSVACGTLTVVMTYLTARVLALAHGRLQSEQWQAVPLLASALVAFNPQFLFISGLVSNDPLLTACCATALWLCVRGPAQTAGGAWWRAAALGGVLGVGLATKQSAVVLGPMIGLSLLVNSDLGSWGRALGPKYTPTVTMAVRRAIQVIGHGLVVGGMAVLLSGWWFVRNWQLYGDPLGLAAFQADFQTQVFDVASAGAWQSGLGQLFSSYWARFGWMNIAPPGAVVWLFAALVALAVVGWLFAVHFVAHRAVLLALVLTLTTCVWQLTFVRTVGLVAWQGRLLFPASTAIALLLAIGLAALGQQVVRVVPMPRQIWLLLPIALAGLALWLPFNVIQPAYPAQTLPEPVALARPVTLVQTRLVPVDGRGAELHGWALRGTLHAGATLDLTLIWHALGRQRRDWTVFVHLVDAQGQIVVANNRQPRNGAFPTGQWATNDWIEDQYHIDLPPTLATGRYRLQVGMYDAEGTLERIGVQNTAGELIGDAIELGTFSVAN